MAGARAAVASWEEVEGDEEGVADDLRALDSVESALMTVTVE